MKNEHETYRRIILKDDVTVDLCRPSSGDGYVVNKLIAENPPLDTNSLYCNLLQCTHFAETSVCAKINEKLAGFISGYLIPEQPDTLFIWQVAVADLARGKGLAMHMLNEILERPVCRRVRYIETTITDTNKSSWRLFEKFAKSKDAETKISVGFEKDRHFHGNHESEQKLKIGPLLKN